MSDVPLEHLTTEARNPDSADLDRLSSVDLVHLMNREDRRAVEAVAAAAEEIGEAIDGIAQRMRHGGRLIYVGAGTSGRLGVVDASECPPTFNAPEGLVVGLIAGGERAFLKAVEGAEDDPGEGVKDLDRIGIRKEDTVVGVAASGRTPYVLGAVRHARALGALTVGVSCNQDSEVAALSEIPITLLVGPEVLTGSTRLKAGTATKLVLNMLSTGAMVRLGKSYGNLMVDLQATNQKLVARSKRIVAEAAGVGLDEAERVLERCDGEVKTAIVVARNGVDPARARDLLKAHGGRVRAALEESGA